MKIMVVCLLALCLLIPFSFALADGMSFDLMELPQHETVQPICWLMDDLYALAPKDCIVGRQDRGKMTVHRMIQQIARTGDSLFVLSDSYNTRKCNLTSDDIERCGL